MCRALLTLVLAVCFGSVSASPVPNVVANSTNAAGHATLQPVSSNVDIVATGVRQLPQNSADDGSVKNDSDWRGYGTLVATLVLMAAIAVRRQRR